MHKRQLKNGRDKWLNFKKKIDYKEKKQKCMISKSSKRGRKPCWYYKCYHWFQMEIELKQSYRYPQLQNVNENKGLVQRSLAKTAQRQRKGQDGVRNQRGQNLDLPPLIVSRRPMSNSQQSTEKRLNKSTIIEPSKQNDYKLSQQLITVKDEIMDTDETDQETSRQRDPGFFLTQLDDQKSKNLSINRELKPKKSNMPYHLSSNQLLKSKDSHTQEENKERMFEQFKLSEFLNQIKNCKEKDMPIEIKGFGFNNCPYAKLIQEEEQVKRKLKKDVYHDRLQIQKNFLKSQTKVREQEHKLFEKLKDELDKAEFEETLREQEEEFHKRNKSPLFLKIDKVPMRQILRDITDLNKKGLEQNMNMAKQRYGRVKSGSRVQSPRLTGQALFNLNKSLGEMFKR